MTAGYIAFHAAERPHAVALIADGRPITYGEFARDIPKFTRAVRDFGLPRGATVAIGCDDVYVHWLLRIGFERLGVVVASLPESAGAASVPFLEDFDLVLHAQDFSSERARRYHQVSPQWLERISAGADAGEAPAWAESPDDPLRMGYTSGTTGIPKRLLFSRRNHENSIAKSIWLNGFTHRSRNLVSLPFSLAGSYTNATACVRSGGTVVVENRMSLAQAITAHAITHATLAPITVKNILDELPGGFTKPAELAIFTWGAAISGGLRDKVLARLATGLCDVYGSNEASAVSAATGNDQFGAVLPGVRVEVVDDRHRPLPFGETGQIRVKTDCMVDGYLHDPEATQRMFRDGWFYAGDLGVLHDAYRLQVIGRSDDLLNIGFNKIAPSALEDLVLKSAEVGDVGICSVPNADGLEEVCVVVAGARGGDQALMERITHAFGRFQFGRFHVIKAAGIPRNANGKIERDVLKRLAAESIRGRSL